MKKLGHFHRLSRLCDQLSQASRGIVSVAPLFLAGSFVLSAAGAAADECGAYAGPNDTITCDTGTYTPPDPIDYGGVDGLTLTLDDPTLDVTATGAAVIVSSDPASTNDILINAENFNTITTAGLNGFGLAAEHAGDGDAEVVLSFGDIETSGNFGFGIYGHITNTGSSGDAIATMNGGSLTLTGPNARGVYTRNQGLGDATSTLNDGTVSTTGVQAWGVFARIQNTGSTGNVSAVMNDGIIETNGDDATNIAGVSGIYAQHQGVGSVSATLNNGQIITTGANSHGVFSRSVNSGSASAATAMMNDGTISTGGIGAHGLFALHQGTGDAVVFMNGGLIETAGDGAHGIFSFAFAGGDALFTMSGGEIDATGDGVQGVSNDGLVDVNIAEGTVRGGAGTSSGIRTISESGSIITIGEDAVLDGSASGLAIRDGDFDLDGVDEINGDTFVTSSGDVTGDAVLGLGNDTVTLLGGRIEGDIYGDDVAAAANDGDDAFIWTDGILAGGYFGGNGSDAANITAASYDGTDHVLDGGDDYATADDWVDVLTLSGGVSGDINGANVRSWERINLDGVDVSLADGALQVGADPNNGLFLINGTVLDQSGADLDLTGNLTNAATLNMQGGTIGDVVTVGGDYAGNMGTLLVDVDTVNDAADTLVIDGDVTGTTRVGVTDVSVGVPTGNDITVVTVAGTSTAGNFVLANGPLTAGAFNYNLAYDPGAFVLRSLGVNGTGAVYETAPSVLGGFNRLPTLEQRVGQRQWANGGANEGGMPPSGTWLRFTGDRTDLAANTGTNSSTDSWGLQAGIDFNVAPGEAGQWVLGITGQYGTSNASVTNALGFGDIDSEGYGLGLTATWYGNSGTYFDAQGQVTWISSDFSSSTGGDLAMGQDSTAYALSAEVGHRFELSETSALIPQAQLVWGQIDGASFTDTAGNAVDLGSNSGTVGRLGLAYEHESDSGKLYAIGNILHDFSGANSVNVAGANLSSDTSETWGEIGFGGSVAVQENTVLYGEVSYRQAFGNSDSEALAATAGISIKW